jgi:hypothetical protein
MTTQRITRKSLAARMGLATGIVATALITTATPSSAAATTVTATPTTGAQNAVISLISKTSTTFKSGSTLNISNTAGTIDAYGVLFQTAACSTGSSLSLPTAEVTGASPYLYKAQSVTVVSGAKIVVKAPATMATGAYNICIYDNAADGSKSTLATSKYTVYAAPTVTEVSPSAGPALGGQAITITGTNFTSKTTAKLNGVTLTVKFVNATTLTATTPAIAPGTDVDLVVTTEGGSATDSTYDVLDGISVTPDTMVGNDDSSTTEVVLDISGAGFSGTTTGFEGANAAVYLITGATWADDAATDVGICASVIVLSDVELICTVDPTDTSSTAGVETPNGSYQVVATADNTDSDVRTTLATSGSAFTVAPY